MLTLGDSTPAARPFLVSDSDESSAELSPDGRYLAYESNQSGQSEVYVQPFPGPGRRELVSTDGGGQPLWARNGRELFYRASGPGPMMRMMAVDVTLGHVFSASRPRVLWETMRARYPGGTGGRTYDVAPNGRRFLMIQQRASAPQPPVTHVVLVQNWLDELKRLVPRNCLNSGSRPSERLRRGCRTVPLTSGVGTAGGWCQAVGSSWLVTPDALVS
jgi:eukaryotic-like serine/threonine-protein kinase